MAVELLKDQSDFDLERLVDMFDEAMSSQDPRVVHALRDLMMMVALTRPESKHAPVKGEVSGPFRKLFDAVNHLNRRVTAIEQHVHAHKYQQEYESVYKTKTISVTNHT